MTTEAEQSTQIHGGRLIAKRLKAHGVTKLFTLSGGHLFSVYDGCRAEGIEIVYYDQLGCGNSDDPKDTSMWDLPRFVER